MVVLMAMVGIMSITIMCYANLIVLMMIVIVITWIFKQLYWIPKGDLKSSRSHPFLLLPQVFAQCCYRSDKPLKFE